MTAASVELAISRLSLAQPATHQTAISAYFGFVCGSGQPYRSAVYRDRARLDQAGLQPGFDDYKLNHNVYPLPYSMQHSTERAFMHRGGLVPTLVGVKISMRLNDRLTQNISIPISMSLIPGIISRSLI